MRKTTIPVLLIFLLGCSVVPFTGRKQLVIIPSEQIIGLSAQSYAEVLKESKMSTNASYISAVRRVGDRLTSAVERYMKQNNLEDQINGFQWQYNVIASDQINAWCMPGGQIAFYEGIMPLCKDDNGIAVVMGHEIAHAIAQHGNERLSQQVGVQLGGMALSEALKTQKETTQQIALLAFGAGTQLGLVLPYSRTHESEADELGLYFMAMAGFDPGAAPGFWQRMSAEGKARTPEFLSTHPDPQKRIRNLNRLMPKAMKYYQAR